MANIKGIELASEIYDLEDETARNTSTQASQTATTASETATQASQTATTASETATQASQTATQADSKIGNLANLITSVKTDLVSAINEIVPKVPSRQVVKVTTRKSSSSNTSELNMDDIIAAGYEVIRGSYLVTVYRNTSLSQSYFIGWVEGGSDDIYNAEFTKIGGRGDTLKESNYQLVYSGGDSSDTTTWIFNPIGDDNVDI